MYLRIDGKTALKSYKLVQIKITFSLYTAPSRPPPPFRKGFSNTWGILAGFMLARTVVLIWHGSSEHVAHVGRKTGSF